MTQRRAALALGLDPTLPPLAALAEWKARRSRLVMHERVTGAKAAFGNSRTGADVDIGLFPTLLWHRCDGGRFIGSGSVVVMRDPDTGWVNASIYRVHVHGPDRVVIQFDHPRGGAARSSPGAGGSAAGALRSRSFTGPIRSCSSPASSISPRGFRNTPSPAPSEGRPLEVVAGLMTGVPVRAAAEIVFEGSSIRTAK